MKKEDLLLSKEDKLKIIDKHEVFRLPPIALDSANAASLHTAKAIRDYFTPFLVTGEFEGERIGFIHMPLSNWENLNSIIEELEATTDN